MLLALLSVFIFVFSVFPVNAMVPQVRLPEWQKTKVYISSWEPTKNKLVVCVELCALTNISEISCKMNLENGQATDDKIIRETIDTKNNKQTIKANTLKSLLKNEVVTFKKEFKVKPNTSDWLDINLRAKPDSNELREIVDQLYLNNPSVNIILKSEIDNIKNPIYIGRITPILTRTDIAVTSVKECTPNLEKINDSNVYLWYPELPLGQGYEAETLKVFSMAVSAKKNKDAETIGNILIKRLQQLNRPLKISKPSGEVFTIPPTIAIDLITGDIATLNSYKTNDTSHIENIIVNMKDSDIKQMLKFNLAVLKSRIGSKAESEPLFEELKKDCNFWPQLYKEK